MIGTVPNFWPGWAQVIPMVAVLLVMPGVLLWVIWTKANVPRHRRPLYIPGSILLPLAVTGIVPILISMSGLYRVEGRPATYEQTARMFGAYSAYVWAAAAGVVVWLVCVHFAKKGRAARR